MRNLIPWTGLLLSLCMSDTVLAFAPLSSDMSKPYNEYTWVSAHNAASKVGGLLPNQKHSMYDQMKDYNVRGLMLDIDLQNDQLEFIHAYADCGVFKDRMTDEVLKYLEEDENAIIFIDIESGSKLTRENLKAGFDDFPEFTKYIFNPADWTHINGRWPTLQELKDAGQRVIVVIDKSGNTFKGETYEVMWRESITIENMWAEKGVNECTERHGYKSYESELNYATGPLGGRNWPRLFTMNHFPSWAMGGRAAAAKTNNWSSVYKRLVFCREAAGWDIDPNFIAVDWVHKGDVPRIADVVTRGGIIYYESELQTQDIVCGLPLDVYTSVNFQDNDWGCENDEARSAKIIKAKKDTVIEVFDNPHGHWNDDVLQMYVKDDAEVITIDSFELFSHDLLGVTRYYHNGLNGKVSSQRASTVADQQPSIVYYAGNHLGGQLVCRIPLYDRVLRVNFKEDSYGCKNDEARSAKILFAKRGMAVTVYDHPGGSKNDDYSTMIVTEDSAELRVNTFEQTGVYGALLMKFHRHNGLDGKVSRHVSVGGLPLP